MSLSYLSDGWLQTNAGEDYADLLTADAESRMFDARDSFLSMFDALFRAGGRDIQIEYALLDKENSLDQHPRYLLGKPLDEVRERILQLNRDRERIERESYDGQVDHWERARFKLNRDLGISWGLDNVVKKARMLDKVGQSVLFTSDILEDFRRRLRPPVHTRQQGIALTFDAKQGALIASKPGLAKVKGVAGCGKTTMLAQRAINAYKRHERQVLILTFNITLRHYIRDTISRLQGGGGHQQHFEVIHYHAFIGSQLNNYEIDLDAKLAPLHLSPAQRADLDFVYGLKALFAGVETERYQTILVDEVQDYLPEWIKLVRDCFLADDGEMVLFGDESQNIYARPTGGRESPIVQGFGAWARLTKSYRCEGDSPLIQLFRSFQVEHLIREYEDSEAFRAKVARSQQSSMRFDLLSYEAYGDTYDPAFILEKVRRYIRDYQIHPNDIALVSSRVDCLVPLNEHLLLTEGTKVMFEEMAEVRVLLAKLMKNLDKLRNSDELRKETAEVLALLAKVMNDSNESWGDMADVNLRLKKVMKDSKEFREEVDGIRRRKKCFFTQNSGLIKLSTTHSFKGLEAETVFCILTSEDDAEMVYTGITRARRSLVVFDTSASRYRSFFEAHMVMAGAVQISE